MVVVLRKESGELGSVLLVAVGSLQFVMSTLAGTSLSKLGQKTNKQTHTNTKHTNTSISIPVKGLLHSASQSFDASELSCNSRKLRFCAARVRRRREKEKKMNKKWAARSSIPSPPQKKNTQTHQNNQQM